ncbi:uncharacterized protein A4U43_C06F9820 [Asparagus officinalis]|uniref:Tryptophan synthase beta chain-like PALP domain-containing protein n=1 Tax=Asparagus officinalis TaxID=4686 RepID=A0A5P1EP55_ASPOF|nr:uncharacterized protein A4U43_C06F9820 [Asparagus officinalis]
MESYQPLSSVKDRTALRMMEDAEEKGLIKPGITILVEGTDPKLGFQGMVERIEQLKEKDSNVYVLDQFSNPANPDAHFTGTGPEIWKDTAGKVDIFVSGTGSGGTLTGAGKYLKMKNPDIKIICVEPAESAVLSVPTSGVRQVAKRVENKGKMIVRMFSSGGERYISTQLFDEVRDECANMSFS